MDLSKVFNCIQHDILVAKIIAFDLSSNACECFPII